MGINKFVYYGETKFDISGDTVTPDTLMEGATAHNKAGNPIVGTAKGGDPSEMIDALLSTSATGAEVISNIATGRSIRKGVFNAAQIKFLTFNEIDEITTDIFTNMIIAGIFKAPKALSVYPTCFDNTIIKVLDLVQPSFFGQLNAGTKGLIEDIVIRGDTVAEMYDDRTFIFPQENPYGRPFRIFVPDNLVSQYKVATNWATYADAIFPLSEYVSP